jgi:hypothetical protein
MLLRVIALVVPIAAALPACERHVEEPMPPVCVAIPERLSPGSELAFCYGAGACIPLPASAASPGQRQLCFDVKSWEGTRYVWRKSNDLMMGLMVDGRAHPLYYVQDAKFEPDRTVAALPLTDGRFRVQGIMVDGSSIVVSKEVLLRSKAGSDTSTEVLVRRDTAERPEGFSESKEKLTSWTGQLKAINPLVMSGRQGVGTLTQIIEFRSADKTYQLWYAPGAVRLSSGGPSFDVIIKGVLIEPRLIAVFEERQGLR